MSTKYSKGYIPKGYFQIYVDNYSEGEEIFNILYNKYGDEIEKDFNKYLNKEYDISEKLSSLIDKILDKEYQKLTDDITEEESSYYFGKILSDFDLEDISDKLNDNAEFYLKDFELLRDNFLYDKYENKEFSIFLIEGLGINEITNDDKINKYYKDVFHIKNFSFTINYENKNLIITNPEGNFVRTIYLEDWAFNLLQEKLEEIN